MSNQTTITITGNLVDDPELRFTPGSRSPGSASHQRPGTGTTPQGSGRTATRCS
jgi:hypothetical protein